MINQIISSLENLILTDSAKVKKYWIPQKR